MSCGSTWFSDSAQKSKMATAVSRTYYIDYVPCLKVYTNKCVNYARYCGEPKSHKAPKRTDFHKSLSDIAKRKIEKIIDFMSDTAKWHKVWCEAERKHVWFRLGFLTLTLPASQLNDFGRSELAANDEMFLNDELLTVSDVGFRYSDDFIKSNILNHYLTILREKYGVHNYLWKAEPQSNGNIHFHIVIDQFIHWKALQYIWNRCLSKTTLIDEFEKKFGHRNPPTIKVHAIRNVESIRKYITKYLAKAEFEKRKINGRKWSCNEDLSKYDGVTIELRGQLLYDKQILFHLPEHFKFYDKFFTIYNLSIWQLATVLEGTRLWQVYVSEFEKKYNFKFQFR